MIVKTIVLIASFSLLLQACAEIPVKQEKKHKPIVKLPYAASTEAIKNRNENKYAQKLQALNNKNPILEAQQEASIGYHFFLGFQGGRGGARTIPGLTLQQAKSSSCGIKRLDGFGDTIYGENHLKYRIALRNYAKKFNGVMYSYCRYM